LNAEIVIMRCAPLRLSWRWLKSQASTMTLKPP
jgi:hypothetical protein